MDGFIMVNDEILQANKAALPLDDRGFLFGDSIFETMIALDHKIVFLKNHVDRLFFSARLAEIPIPWKPDQLKESLQNMVKKVDMPRVYIRLVVTRGSGFGLQPDRELLPRKILYAIPLEDPPPEPAPIKLGLQPTWQIAKGPQAKIPQYLTSIVNLRRIKSQGYHDILYYNQDRNLTESSCSNIFFIRKEQSSTPVLETPDLSCGLLAGITRQAIINICRENRFEVVERKILTNQIEEYGEAFLTSTIRGLTPVSEIQKRKLCSQNPGGHFKKIKTLFEAYRKSA